MNIEVRHLRYEVRHLRYEVRHLRYEVRHLRYEVRHLRYFVAVAEEASFTAAAQRVHVAQQVLSTQIRQLENAVGFELPQRNSRGVVLTAAGSAFLGFAREAFSAYRGWCHS